MKFKLQKYLLFVITPKTALEGPGPEPVALATP